jgi:hypothetical protein
MLEVDLPSGTYLDLLFTVVREIELAHLTLPEEREELRVFRIRPIAGNIF